MRFKDYLTEKAKKAKEEPLVLDREHSRLRDMQEYLTHKKLGPQLFVPKRRDPKKMRELETNRRMWSAYSDLQKQVKEDTVPLLTAMRDTPVAGNNKPSNGFWTSTAIKKGDGYTSDWYRYVQNNHQDWQTDYGFLFDVDPTAQVFDLSYAEQFYEWAMDHSRMSLKAIDSEYYREYSREDMRYRFPWDQLARYFDAAHTFTPYRSDDFLYGWDVESTVWFNTKYLKYRGAVKLAHFGDEDEE